MTSTMKTMTKKDLNYLKDRIKTIHSQQEVFRPCLLTFCLSFIIGGFLFSRYHRLF